jgi:hypothetical protein
VTGHGDKTDHDGASAVAVEIVAKRKPASTISDEKSDRQLSADASRQTGP